MSELLTLMEHKQIQTLKHLGFSETEVRVYLALLELGQGSVTEIAKKAQIKRPTVYLAIERLDFFGLLSKTKIGKRFQYFPVHPRRLQQLLVNRKNSFDSIYKNLEKTYYQSTARPQVQVLEGQKAVVDTYTEVFEKIAEGSEMLTIGNISSVLEKHGNLSKEYIQRLLRTEKPKIREVIFDSDSARKWVKEIKSVSKSNTHQIRLIDKSFEFGNTDCLIVGNTTYMFSLGTEVFVTIIESEELTKTQRAMFEWLWMQSEAIEIK